MRGALRTGIAAVALAGAFCLSAAAPQAAATPNWTETVAVTPEGGYRLGNPQAAVKLVEYGSLTCGHCARFAQQGVPELVDKYVRSGRVSFEFRNFVRDPADMAAAVLSRCAATGDFFPLTHRYFQTQKQWFDRIQASMPAQKTALERLAPEQRVGRVASMGALDTAAARHGVTPAKAKTCLADPKAHAALVELRKTAVQQHKVNATPTFLINGAKAEKIVDWAGLEPLLAPPGG